VLESTHLARVHLPRLTSWQMLLLELSPALKDAGLSVGLTLVAD
jgi:hypothetical protein